NTHHQQTPTTTLYPYTTLFRSHRPTQSLEELLARKEEKFTALLQREEPLFDGLPELLEKVSARYSLALASGSRHPTINVVLELRDRKSTRLNSSHRTISYAVFC